MNIKFAKILHIECFVKAARCYKTGIEKFPNFRTYIIFGFKFSLASYPSRGKMHNVLALDGIDVINVSRIKQLDKNI